MLRHTINTNVAGSTISGTSIKGFSCELTSCNKGCICHAIPQEVEPSYKSYIGINANYKVKNFPRTLHLISLERFKKILCTFEFVDINGVIAAGKSYFINRLNRGLEDRVVIFHEPNNKFDALLANDYLTGKESVITEITNNEITQSLDILFKYILDTLTIVVERTSMDHLALFRDKNDDEIRRAIKFLSKIFKRIRKHNKSKILKCAIVTVFDTNIQNYKSRVEMRGRMYEKKITVNYLERLQLAQLIMLCWYPHIFVDCDFTFYAYKPNITSTDDKISVNNFIPELFYKGIPLRDAYFTNDLLLKLLIDSFKV